MAYFANSSEGAAFYRECEQCVFDDEACPISLVQSFYNYDAVNNETATNILGLLVSNQGECKMLRKFPEMLRKQTNQYNS